MSEILQTSSDNPLSTLIGKKIEAATRPELEADDRALNLEICDIINENDDESKDAVRAIRERLQQIEQDPNFTVINRTLTVLETCVSNCSHRFHVLVMTKDFIQDLEKLIGPKNNPPIDLQERVLRMIERWADAFKDQPDLAGVVEVYDDLKSKGVTFPERDPSSSVPIQTPQQAQSPDDQAKADDEEEEEDDDEDEDDVKITIEDVDFNILPKSKQPRQARPVAVDLEAGQAILDLDLNSIDDKPWRKPGADISDYFNYGFDEDTWRLYCEKQKKMRGELHSLSRKPTDEVMQIPTIVSVEPRHGWMPPITAVDTDKYRDEVRPREREQDRDREPDRDRERERDRDRERDREREKTRTREKDRDRKKTREREKVKERDRPRERERSHRDSKKRERSRERDRDKKRKRT